MTIDYGEALTRLEPLALAAGRIVMDAYRGGCAVETKTDDSPVTWADREAERIILEGLRRDFPQIPIVAEEEVSAGLMPADLGTMFFLVDPLDGTREFVNRSEDFTVNIALVVDGMPALGVVYAPARHQLYLGQPGRCEMARTTDDHEIEGRREIHTQTPGPTPVVVASRSHRTIETNDYLAKLPQAEIVSVGSSLKFCMIASGAADFYPRFGPTMQWDTAAGDAVLRAAGGRTRTLDGDALSYGCSGRPEAAAFANPWFISDCGIDAPAEP
ncbi:MAG: 3'(2'),5'-bisphosphate nucleotidase CysQ [Aliihoeflea sp.]|uniref:3'(2'),5'-bisphosphate nucleotidase CysQ n=1 Tax=Aliihoeflea sp. TaxID=2608088 RepID=UPI004034A38A